MPGLDKKQIIEPEVREAFNSFGRALSGAITVAVLTSDVNLPATTSAWSYEIAFEIRDSAGKRCEWFDGTITAAAGDTSTAGTASVDDATPAVESGKGTVTLSGDAAAWVAAEAATCTFGGSIPNLGITLNTPVFTVTVV